MIIKILYSAKFLLVICLYGFGLSARHELPNNWMQLTHAGFATLKPARRKLGRRVQFPQAVS